MKAERRTLSPLQRVQLDNARSAEDEVKAILDYNIMMGNLEDPEEIEERGE